MYDYDHERVARELDSLPDDEEKGKKSAATTLVEMAEKMYRFGVSLTGEVFGVPKTGPRIVTTLRGNNSLRSVLAERYFRVNSRAASQQALTDALQILEGMARQREPEALALRVAEHEGAIYLDMADPDGRAIRIKADGCDIVSHAPILFKRTALTGALPEPDLSGDISIIWQWLNVTEQDRPLILASLVAALYPDIPHPVVAITGEQGSAKTTGAKLYASILDPGPVPVRKPPRDADQWILAASGSWVVALDNLSQIPAWLSDSICRAVTGDGDIRRQLYSDGDFSIFAFRRCVVLNGIDLGATRGDLAERMIPLWFERIPDDKRLAEDEIWPLWAEAHPMVLGAVLNLAAGVAGVIPGLSLTDKPRMADFAKVLAAVDQVLGTNGLQTYLDKQGEMAGDSLTADPFILALADKGCIKGTASEILEKLTPERAPRGWPENARAVTALLRRQSPVMRKAGWHVVNDAGRNHMKVIVWDISPPDNTRNFNPQYPQDPRTDDHAGDAGMEYTASPDAEIF